MRGLPDEVTQDGVSPLADVEKLVIEGRYGRADLALRRLEALIPSLAPASDTETLLLALYGRALLLRQLGAGTQNAIAACDVLERAAHEREAELWVATACATRARFRVDSGDIGGATADLARADAEAATGDLTNDTGYRLLDGLALVYAGLRLHDRADEVRDRIEHSIGNRRVLDQAQHWSTWSGEMAARAMEPLAGGAPDPQHELMGRAIEIAAKLDGLPEQEVPSTLRRGARGVRALSAAYRGRPSEALRLLGPDAFGTVGDLPLVERQIVSLAAMRAHALVGSLATARSLDDAATTPPATLPNLVLEVCRTRERLWLETYAGGDVIPVLHRMTELLVRLGWRGMDLVADTARQALEHQALRTESRTDALTGVGNRRALDEELRQLLRFGPLPLALILVDIDHFKGVNDVYTHVVGDEVLRRVAASLSLQLRSDDQLLRYGGDEFVVLLPGTGDEEADAVADRMAAAVAARPWSELADGLKVSVTTGVAAVWSLSGRRPDADAEKLFRRADERLLDGKRSRPEVSRSHQRPAPAEITVEVAEELTEATTLDVAALDEVAPDDVAVDVLALDVTALDVAALDEVAQADELGDDDLEDDEPAALTATGALRLLTERRAGPGDPPITVTGRPALTLTEEPSAARATGDENDADDDDPLAPAAGPAPDSTPAWPRVMSRAAMRPPAETERRPRSVFDPDPDLDLDAESPVIELSPRPSGRRDGRARPIDVDASRRNGVSALAPVRSRREARAAGLSALPGTSAGRDAAEADAAAREVAKAQAEEARKRAAREGRARDDAARDAEVRARAEHEKAVRDAEARDLAASEKAARETEAREAAAREAAAYELAVREQAARETEAREHAAREQAAREQAAREEVARAQAAKEKAAREAAEAAAREAAETAAREAAEAAAREAAEAERRRAAEQARLEQERREAEAREQERRELEARQQAAREKAAREAAEAEARAKAVREKAAQERAAREAAELAAREAAEAERRRAAEQARVEAERRRVEQERREAEAERRRVEQERREAEARAEQERREALIRARIERERLERELAEQERLVRERRERERREAQEREAERLRQEAQARAEAEAHQLAIERARARAEAEAQRARAADRIREEAYARAAEQARRVAGGSFPSHSHAPGNPSHSPAPSHAPSHEREYETGAHDGLSPAAAIQPTQRRAPLYDASRRPEEPEPFRERRSHPRPSGQPIAEQFASQPTAAPQPAPEPEPEADTTAIRTRREPFGPPTRSQAIIDLSARKRPRNPYSS